MDLIGKYPSLAQFLTIDKNGVYGIEQAGWDALIQEQKNKISSANKNAIGANIYMYQSKNEVDQNRTNEAIKNNLKNSSVVYGLDAGIGQNSSSLRLGVERQGYLYEGTGAYSDIKAGQYTTDLSYKKDAEELEKLGVSFQNTSREDQYGTVSEKMLDFNQFQGKTVEELDTMIKNLSTLDIDPELKKLLEKQIKTIRDNNATLAENQNHIDANTEALLNTIANDNGVDSQVFTAIGKVIEEDNKGEVGSIKDLRENNDLISFNGKNYSFKKFPAKRKKLLIKRKKYVIIYM
jgi:hypothetical protein